MVGMSVFADCSDLAGDIGELYAGAGRPAVLLAEFRRRAVLVPLSGPGAVWSLDGGGVRWLLAFTSVVELGLFARERQVARWEWVSVLGSRLLDVAVPAVGVPAGVVLDVAGVRPLFLPPVEGVVPFSVAVAGV